MKKMTSWVCTAGNVKEDSGKIKYTPSQQELNGALLTVWATIKSNCYFNSGKINFNVKLSESSTTCQLSIGSIGTPISISINGGQGAYTVHGWDQTQKQQGLLGTVGLKGAVPIDEFISVEVEIIGSSGILRVSGVEVLRFYTLPYQSQISFSFWGEGEAEVENFHVTQVKPKVFAVMQFTNEFNELHSDVIKPVCAEYDLEVIRADDIYNNGFIIQDIINSINESTLIIADITPDNPNVYYEVGYAHASAKPVILLCDNKRDKLPFDLSSFRTIFYSDSIAGKKNVELQLRKHLEALLPRKVF